MEFQVQFVEIRARQIAHFHVLQMVPTSLIPGTEVGCVTGQGFHMNLLALWARQKLAHRAPAMNRRTIPDRHHFSPRLTSTIPRHPKLVKLHKESGQTRASKLPSGLKTSHKGKL